VRDALAHLYDPIYLQTHPLGPLVTWDGARPTSAGKVLREFLLDVIESLHPLARDAGPLLSGASYQILRLRYVEGQDVAAIQRQLALGRSEFYREQQRGVEAVVSLLWDRWHASSVLAPESLRTRPVGSEGEPEPAAVPSRHNLPVPTTIFIARAGELAQVEQRLWDNRLLTITGSGGCGKTRLAIEVARAVADGFADGTWLVDLAPLTDPGLVPQAIATAMDLREAPGRPVLATLVDHLRARRALLVLDNCEHLIDACARVVEALLQSCSEVRILATSRELLGIAGEATWRVPSLSLVDSRILASAGSVLVDSALQAESVHLFADRARLVAPSFRLTSENARAAAQICQRLDGIPLAIELAAARLAVLSVDEVAARLDQRFRLLSGGHRTALRRQQTLRATIDWSYQLLADAERTLLRRLAVFAGGWTLGAAEAIVADPALVADDVLDLLSQLVAKSLVQVEEPSADSRRDHRYRLLVTIRQYAEEKLLDADEAEAVRTRHRDWYLDLAERALPELERSDQKRWADRLESEHDNLRAALSWSAGHPADALALLHLAAVLGKFWQYRGHSQEAIGWLSLALERSEASPSHDRARALNWLGAMEWIAGHLDTARSLLEESVALARTVGDGELRAKSLRHLSYVVQSLGDEARARHLLEEGVTVSRAAGYKREVAYCLQSLALILANKAAPDTIEGLLVESLPIARESGDALVVCDTLLWLGWVYHRRGELERAQRVYEECLLLARQADLKVAFPDVLVALGDLATTKGDLAAAVEWYRQVFPLVITSARGLVAYVFERYAAVCIAQGDYRRAAILYGAAAVAPRMAYGFHLFADSSGAEEDQKAARQGLGETEFAAAWAEGRAMTLEQVADYALSAEGK
jgi:non-specific serine/threonine protein kinase